VIRKEKKGEREREITAADGSALQLVPQEAVDRFGAPFRFRLPWSPELEAQLNQANFRITGVKEREAKVTLSAGEQREITFTYSSGSATARKTFKFYGDRFLFDVTAEVTSSGQQQPAQLVLGPRIGDQRDDRTNGSYSTPHQVIAFNRLGDREAYIGARITPQFAKIISVDHSSGRVQIDKPLAAGVDQIKIVQGDDYVLVGYARIVGRESNDQTLVVDSLPASVAAGHGVAQAVDIVRHGYKWAGVVDHYFTMVAIFSQPADEITLTNFALKNLSTSPSGGEKAEDQPARDYPSVAVPVRADSVTHILVAPKDRQLLSQVGADLGTDLEALIDYGFFAFMVRPIIPAIGWALDGLAAVFHNYGWSIVVVTVVINLFLSPLRFYSSKKMKAAAKHQPRMKELQEKLKKLKESPKKSEREMQELQREQMALMKEANPLGGCLPLLLQMPIFWAFFIYLTISLDVRHAPWVLWVKDLSRPDPYYVLPIVMCVTMIASTKLMPQPPTTDPSMKMQRIMMTWLMPIMLTWLFFFQAPTGLVLYWMVSNVVGVVIQLVINKATAEPAPVGPSAPVAKAATKAAKRKAPEKEVVGSVK
jgi:YidC/Oxa1 family membrane protein insertase